MRVERREARDIHITTTTKKVIRRRRSWKYEPKLPPNIGPHVRSESGNEIDKNQKPKTKKIFTKAAYYLPLTKVDKWNAHAHVRTQGCIKVHLLYR